MSYIKISRHFLVVITAFCLTSMVTGTLQQMTFFQESDCTGENDTLTETQSDLNDTRIGQAASMQALGIWQVTGYKRLENGQSIRLTVTHYNKPPTAACGVWDGNGFVIYSAKRFGGEDMAEPQVVFYTEDNFSGEDYTVTGDNPEVGLQPFESQSYILFSNYVWAVYPEQNYTGVPTYISPNWTGVEDPTDDFSYGTSTNFTVGSIRKLAEATTTTTTPTTTITTEDSTTTT